ncbi:PaaI family thioesterase [Chengkuizengella axinellae]|uniref:PaaI family thioesterase n=1 Tax=Chengkuizengella axinellae TaxID=3064388 RepID=A0ABT9IUA4_9BACL|nr:PaaI family thioesterase [Chengkuizengella sp. 2205SS18-9]MDP5272936.1 PaaI family thioesterase [Chengkuizengella sp. 2205SS18-9]
MNGSMNEKEWKAFQSMLEEKVKGTFMELFNSQITEINKDQIIGTFTVEPIHLNPNGIIHGGVHASVLDSIMGLAVVVARPNEKLVTTMLNIHYLTALKEGTLGVSAKVLHQTNQTLTTEGEIRSEEGELVAIATGSYRVINK